jgi:hypothetical protein
MTIVIFLFQFRYRGVDLHLDNILSGSPHSKDCPYQVWFHLKESAQGKDARRIKTNDKILVRKTYFKMCTF